MTAKWDLETTKTFIQQYACHECLWNYNSPYYNNRERRNTAYRSVAEAMGLPNFGIEEVKIKIKNLRSSYRQELKKVEESKTSLHVYESNLKWFKDLAPIYLKRKVIKKKHKNGSYDEDLQESKSSEDEDNFHKTTIEAKLLQSQLERKRRTQEAKEALPLPESMFKRKKQESFRLASDNTAIEPDKYKRDESDVFGESVAMQLKKMSEEKALLAKSTIQTILTEIRIEDLKKSKQTASTHSNRIYSSLGRSGNSRNSYSNHGSTSTRLESNTSDPLVQTEQFMKFNVVSLEDESYEVDGSDDDDNKDLTYTDC